MIKFNKLFAILAMRGMKKTDLLKVMSTSTLARLSSSRKTNVDTVDRICAYLEVQPGDIMEWVPDEEVKE
jgi:DNA-binding Xre family transcriptional regulator